MQILRKILTLIRPSPALLHLDQKTQFLDRFEFQPQDQDDANVILDSSV